MRGFAGGYDTVRRFVQPLRTAEALAERASVRFETPPGQQSQIDWGSSRVHFCHHPVVLHMFILTLGYSRRHFMAPTLDERVPQPRASLRPTAHDLQPGRRGRRDLEPDVPGFRALLGLRGPVMSPVSGPDQGQGRVGREVRQAQLPCRPVVRRPPRCWRAVAGVERHRRRRARPRDHAPVAAGPLRRRATSAPATRGTAGVQARGALPRIVGEDFLVSLDTNRYSVPFTLIGHTAEAERRDGQVRIHHRGKLVATHAELPGRHGLVVLPEHGPGPAVRNARMRRATHASAPASHAADAITVEQRDLTTYDSLLAPGGAR